MFIHPAVHLDITRQRHEAALAPAKRHLFAEVHCSAALVAEPEVAPSFLGRLRRSRRPRRILQDARESA
jgi:hypothetical protein